MLSCLRWLQIGSDPRLTGPLLRSALAAGIVSKGASVADFGLATTPAMFMSCILPGQQHISLPVPNQLLLHIHTAYRAEYSC